MKLRLLLYVSLFTFSTAYAFISSQNFRTTTRGVSYLAPGSVRSEMHFGVNADLDQYNDADLSRALGLIRDARVTIVRQHFYWKDIELSKGEYNWDKWDRIVAGTKQNGLELVAVIDTTPVWARDPGEADLPNASPKNPDDYARFISAFAQRYPGIRYIQIWDNPNVHPFWGRRIVDPKEYFELLKAAAISARATNPNVKIISAGLAANAELIRGHADYSDVLFLRGMYDAGAKNYFDINGAKPYGMWSGPDDRRTDKDIFNFSRAIVLRDEMIAHGDSNKPMWAVEFGWNSLPTPLLLPPSATGGMISPWGSDTEEKQSARLFDGIQRANSEWNWMGAMIIQTLQPNAPSDDPVWGFALVDKNFQLRAAYSALSRAIAAPAQPASFDFTRFYLTIAALAIVAVFSVWRGIRVALKISWSEYWRIGESQFGKLSELAQFLILAFTVIAFYFSPNPILNFVLLAFIVLFFALRLDLGLAITVFTIPFYLQTKNLVGGAQFSLVELLTLASVAAWVFKRILEIASSQTLRAPRNDMPRVTFHPFDFAQGMVSRFTPMDWAVLFFVFAGLLSVNVAANFGVANREFRVIVLEPAVMYALIRASGLEIEGLKRLVNVLILSALAISLLGLYQFFFSNYVIIGEGVRRILSVYGSPNNLALYLDRVLPMLIALAIFDDAETPTLTLPRFRRGGKRVIYALVAVPIAVCLYLTYSRAALLFALPAGLAVVAIASGRRARIALGALFIVGLIALIPFTQTARWQSLFQEGTGTGFFRVSVWQSAFEMGWQHPIFGVGLDNFLYEYPKYIKPEAWREPNLSHPHNIVLDFWTRMGIPGLIALGWMVGAFFTPTLRPHPSPPPSATGEGEQGRALVIALMAGMVATIAHGMVDAAYFFVDLAFVWMLMLGVISRIANRK